ncbi:MAG: dihydrofolate reductase family protein [Acidobacteriia bacterium]|nr:dihydrofolate reductase family protein [Terriglobia bacterium]
MSKLRLQITMTLDGYVAGPNQSVENPLGEGGMRIHDWARKLKGFREMHGDTGRGETGTNNDVLREAFENIGATIMGRSMFGGGPGPWSKDPWTGWWGENPPFHTPVFVLTHHARDPLVMKGGTTFHFVTGGIEAALDQAMRSAGGKDVALGGGANAAQQYLAAGLVDELEIHLVPLLLGGGERLLDGLGGAGLRLEPIRTIAGPGVAHLKYRVVKPVRR